jgi:hypothetical protein
VFHVSSSSNASQGEKQPFYHLIVDNTAWRDAGWDSIMIPCAYVPQEQLWAPADQGSTWVQTYSGHRLQHFIHPYSYLLFLGNDNAGDFVPVPELRNLYGVPRKDVYPVEGDGDSPESGEGAYSGEQ